MEQQRPENPQEIQSRLTRRYLDRLGQKIRKIRLDLLEKNWEALRSECQQLKTSAESFNFKSISLLAATATDLIPEGEVSKLRPLPEARRAVESLIAEIDAVLAEYSAKY
jgi:HPt (histidine-containing phosphotransfer) domain-containing protein